MRHDFEEAPMHCPQLNVTAEQWQELAQRRAGTATPAPRRLTSLGDGWSPAARAFATTVAHPPRPPLPAPEPIELAARGRPSGVARRRYFGRLTIVPRRRTARRARVA